MSHSYEFHEILLGLFKAAKRDGIITDSEAAIIDNVKLNLNKFSHMVTLAEKDGFIDKSEFESLNKMKESISMQAYETALIDNLLSHHEVALLKSLVKLLNKYLGV